PGRPMGHEQVPGWATNTFQSLEFGVLLEVEGFASKIGGENQSDILLATAAFDVEASMNEWLIGHIGLLWEQYSREDDNLDEAYIALGASESLPFYLVAGRFYQPVGNFESVFISDPLTLELAEMNQVSAMVGYENPWLDLNAGAFRGDVKEGVAAGGDSTIDDFYASLSLAPVEQLQLGIYWLSDLMESYNMSRVGEEISGLVGYEKSGGAGAFVNLYLGIFTFNAEYVSALQSYDLPDGSYVPAAFNLEGSVQVHENVTVGLKFEASNDLYATYDAAALAFGEKLPGQSYGAVVAYQFHENASVAAEYLHLEELDNDARGDIVTVQLGLAF
ncbi:MAG: LbtU family siderophore porin, partial [Verrucomicrobiota bacterium]|nr:LbtU family siderophore porin [Verrucomicrobiota bacterium]